MFYLVSENFDVIGVSPTRREVYGKIMHFARVHFQDNPTMVGSFDDIINPEGLYVTRSDNIYTLKKYTPNHGYVLSSYSIDTVVIHVSEFSAEQRSKLKPASYLEALKMRQVDPLPLVRS